MRIENVSIRKNAVDFPDNAQKQQHNKAHTLLSTSVISMELRTLRVAAASAGRSEAGEAVPAADALEGTERGSSEELVVVAGVVAGAGDA
jgi:hypothetical protein